MVSALGVNIQLVFAGAFFLGAALAGLGGVFGGTMVALGPGEDSAFLLNSLIVVIIGGMGSLGGAAIGALALGLVQSYAQLYLVIGGTDYTFYAILLTFALLVLVLAVRPLGPLRSACLNDESAPHHHGRSSRTRSRPPGDLPTRNERLLHEYRRGAGTLARDRRGEHQLSCGIRRHGVTRADRSVRVGGLYNGERRRLRGRGSARALFRARSRRQLEPVGGCCRRASSSQRSSASGSA